jgi:hypothetical protein
MSLVPNKKNKKDNRPGGGAAAKTSVKAGFVNSAQKTNTKGMVKNTKLTGGSQRGS